jgi:hypothetical protein
MYSCINSSTGSFRYCNAGNFSNPFGKILPEIQSSFDGISGKLCSGNVGGSISTFSAAFWSNSFHLFSWVSQ